MRKGVTKCTELQQQQQQSKKDFQINYKTKQQPAATNPVAGERVSPVRYTCYPSSSGPQHSWPWQVPAHSWCVLPTHAHTDTCTDTQTDT